MPILARLKSWARDIKRDVHALYLASRDPRVPWYAKFAAVCVAAYALSPIDLIPDFIPVLGYLDDAILLPLAILLVIKLIPPPIMAEHRAVAVVAEGRPASRAGAPFIVGLWIAAALLLLWLFWPGPAVASLMGLPLDQVEAVTAEARARKAPLHAVTAECPKLKAGKLPYRPRALR